ncbi:hypothetical protein NRA58_18300 [Acinetobacter baumannii]|uniref:hypothetical protein n=1 Tax=Acinetobacter baumannii TaxID=470 RepID=UPI0023414BA9|nr:hypothetical protein [Acinetobacter baumannii]MDC4919652.1 hypothetical protein [Acinetobacter baumannii]MDC4934118.1 hypothetical protein [Acinetobacter baumannii]MDC5522343.1 hypothetical protein [Acinetobacter baumannii]
MSNFNFVPNIDASISKLAFLRVAGVSVSYVDNLPGEDSSEIRRELREKLEKKCELQAFLVNCVFNEIKLKRGKEINQSLISIKRNIFNNRKITIPLMLRDYLRGENSVLLQDLENYIFISDECDRVLMHFNSSVNRNMELTSEIIHEVYSLQDFKKALSLAAPRLITMLSGREWHEISKKKRLSLEKSIFNYFIRASMKVSPFSSFGTSARIELDYKLDNGYFFDKKISFERQVLLNRSIAVGLREALYKPEKIIERNFSLKMNHTLRKVSWVEQRLNRKVTCIRGRARFYQIRQGTLWAEESNIYSTNLVSVYNILISLDNIFTPKQLINSLKENNYSIADAENLIRNLLRKDIIRPAIQWQANNKPTRNIADFFKENMSFYPDLLPWDDLYNGLNNLDELVVSFQEAEAEARPDYLLNIRKQWINLHNILDKRAPKELRTLLYENVILKGIELKLPKKFIDNTINRIAKVVASTSSFSLDYLWLRQHFIKIYGVGGECNQVADFIESSWIEFINFSSTLNNIKILEVMKTSREILSEEINLPITAYIQFVASDFQELVNGTPRVVINTVYNRVGWQSARSTITPDGYEIQKDLKKWLDSEAYPQQNITFSVSGESSNLQEHLVLSDKELCIDEDLIFSNQIGLDKLRIKHDKLTGMLQVTDSLGNPIKLQYIGGATPMPAWGAKFLLIVLSEPLQVGRPAAELVVANEETGTFLNSYIRYQPRFELDKCVLLRETWWIRSSWLRDNNKLRSREERVGILLDLFNEFSIPEEVFVNGQHNDFLSWEALTFSTMRKPMWCKISNPFCADYIFDLARDAEWVVLRESLPSPSSSWLNINNKPYVSEMMFEMNIKLNPNNGVNT